MARKNREEIITDLIAAHKTAAANPTKEGALAVKRLLDELEAHADGKIEYSELDKCRHYRRGFTCGHQH